MILACYGSLEIVGVIIIIINAIICHPATANVAYLLCPLPPD